MAVATITTDSDGPLTQSHQREVTAAYDRAKIIRKAASVAAFNGWMTGIIAFCSAPFAIFSLSGFIVTIGLSIVTYNEFRGRKRLLQFDQEAPVLLGWNQVGFLVLIISYCTWMLVVSLTSDGPFTAELKAKPELSVAFNSAEQFDRYYKMLVAGLYGAVIMLTGVFQGFNAFYYFTRRKHIKAYVENTPGWVLDLQRLTPTN
ncbi:MAG TPA: hypothetical protein EYG57_15840 [Planctomycetes bacterium]|nr:hypothetical protein [Planctomycetaceae bacterium]HIM31005.1 hypothetical protein [Planctomycetota bacterium]